MDAHSNDDSVRRIETVFPAATILRCGDNVGFAAGVNIGVSAPMSFFGFGGAKGSFFGDLKAHGREAFDFYTDRKVLISRW